MHLFRVPEDRPVVAFAGELVVDKLKHTPCDPSKNGQTTILKYEEILGGCAPNGALGAKMAGARQVRLIGHRGADETGKLVAKVLAESRIDVQHMVVRGHTAFADIDQWSVERRGQAFERRQKFFHGGAATLSVEDVLEGVDSDLEVPPALQGVGVLVLNCHHLFNPNTERWVQALADRARQFNIGIVVDLSNAADLKKYAARYRSETSRRTLADTAVDRIERFLTPNVVVMNEAEWHELGGNGRPSEIVNRVDATVVHRGLNPTLVFDRYGNRYEPVAVEEQVAVREIGAGDAFAGGLAAAWIQGHTDIVEMVRSGHEAASKWVSSPAIDLTIGRNVEGPSLDLSA